MQLIGKGTFSKVYAIDENRVKIVSSDPVKECLALWGFGDSPLWPVLERTDSLDNGDNVFIGTRYKTGRGVKGLLNPRAYRLYLALRKCGDKHFFGKNQHDALQHWQKVFTEGLVDEFADEREAICEAVDSLCNYGEDIRFEISPRNVAADKAGGLILLDVFFFVSHLREKTGRG
jgi:hypothetical protein